MFDMWKLDQAMLASEKSLWSQQDENQIKKGWQPQGNAWVAPWILIILSRVSFSP
jgi:hypothetical protein